MAKYVLDTVAAFYENDKHSSSLARRKDFVSIVYIGKNMQKQKRLIHSNLNELF